ncbi:hypothetical protein [Anaerotruncus rubiinfantis]|uniref:hypothetical protein n=1 Tax=Anaerotruncus rubiinfantis TaxID=1720200 RepID=UPI000833FCCE|nr:hypothetical protein [Anaerotruncus rubiinfantis]
MKLSNAERETILRFDEESSIAELYTNNGKIMKRLLQLSRKRPELYEVKPDSTGAVTGRFPKSLVSISLREPMSEQERQIRRERAKKSGYQAKRAP